MHILISAIKLFYKVILISIASSSILWAVGLPTSKISTEKELLDQSQQNLAIESYRLIPYFEESEANNLANGLEAFQKENYAQAMEFLWPLAGQGNMVAQLHVGWIYGNSVIQDHQEEAKWYRLAANQGNRQAQFYLGNLYVRGNGVDQNYKEALKWYSLASEQGDMSAQYNLGMMHFNGEGVKEDYHEAVKFFRLAAEQGNSEAQSLLGVLYTSGTGVEKDYQQALKWYQRAAEQGNIKAQYNLGVMYAKGYVVEQNYVNALMWFNLSASKGDEEAEKGRAIAIKRMTLSQITNARKMAQDCEKKNYKDCG